MQSQPIKTDSNIPIIQEIICYFILSPFPFPYWLLNLLREVGGYSYAQMSSASNH